MEHLQNKIKAVWAVEEMPESLIWLKYNSPAICGLKSTELIKDRTSWTGSAIAFLLCVWGCQMTCQREVILSTEIKKKNKNLKSCDWFAPSPLQCGICLCSISVFEDPVDMSCGHEFCRACWEGYAHEHSVCKRVCFFLLKQMCFSSVLCVCLSQVPQCKDSGGRCS